MTYLWTRNIPRFKYQQINSGVHTQLILKLYLIVSVFLVSGNSIDIFLTLGWRTNSMFSFGVVSLASYLLFCYFATNMYDGHRCTTYSGAVHTPRGAHTLRHVSRMCSKRIVIPAVVTEYHDICLYNRRSRKPVWLSNPYISKSSLLLGSVLLLRPNATNKNMIVFFQGFSGFPESFENKFWQKEVGTQDHAICSSIVLSMI